MDSYSDDKNSCSDSNSTLGFSDRELDINDSNIQPYSGKPEVRCLTISVNQSFIFTAGVGIIVLFFCYANRWMVYLTTVHLLMNVRIVLPTK